MKPAREARKGGVWLFERRHLPEWRTESGSGNAWHVASETPRSTRAEARHVATRLNEAGVYEYRAVRYLPANPRRSTRRKRK